MKSSSNFELVTLPGGATSVRSVVHGETMHVGTDPVTESRALHVTQQRLPERVAEWTADSPFVIWDVGLGPAANALAVILALKGSGVPVEIHSFEIDTAVLEFSLGHASELGYLAGWESIIAKLLDQGNVMALPGIRWVLHRGDFSCMRPESSPPSAILFDPYSPARNPEMWNLGTFRLLRGAAADHTPCLLTNYTRSTSVRVTMLMAGWFVGRGVATGGKEETTVAANHPSLLSDPLDASWLRRVRSSTNAAPLRGRLYNRAPISGEDAASLEAHPQFSPRPFGAVSSD